MFRVCVWYNGACCGFLIGKPRYKNQKVPRSCQHSDYGRNFETIWRRAHTKILHVGIGGNGPTQNTQKVGSEQRDGRMDGKRES